MCLPMSTAVASSAYGIDAATIGQVIDPVAAKYVPPTISGPQIRSTLGSPRPRFLRRNGGAA